MSVVYSAEIEDKSNPLADIEASPDVSHGHPQPCATKAAVVSKLQVSGRRTNVRIRTKRRTYGKWP
jgi:hypothetical protein